MKKDIEKFQENFSEITDGLHKLGEKLRNDFLTGSMEDKDRDNDIKISKVDNPSGDNFCFESNHLSLSTISKLELNHSNFCKNSINAATIKSLSLFKSDLCECKIQGGVISEVSLIESEINDCELSAVKLADFSLGHQSMINHTKLTGVSMKSAQIHSASKILDSKISMCAWSDTHLDNTVIEKTELTGVVLDKVVWQNMNLSNVKMTDIIFNNVTISNFDLCDYEIEHLHIKDVIIDSKQKLMDLIKKGLL